MKVLLSKSSVNLSQTIYVIVCYHTRSLQLRYDRSGSYKNVAMSTEQPSDGTQVSSEGKKRKRFIPLGT